MLEHLAQSMGHESGGGALYFRNRIRDRLAAEDLKVSTHEDNTSLGDQKIPVSKFSISPLQNDPYVADKIELTESTITLTFSADVPGYLVSIAYASGPNCLLYTSPSPRDATLSRMPSSA